MSVPARAEILALITEMAARLGRAPGRKLFADETGITESMWATYWPRWITATSTPDPDRNVNTL